MHIEVFKSSKNGKWYWHFRQSNGRIVSDAQPFASEYHATRAAKAVVNGIRKRFGLLDVVTFHVHPQDARGIIKITFHY